MRERRACFPAPGVDADYVEVSAFLDAVAGLVQPVQSHFIWWPQLRDPSDEMVLEAAVNGAADAIVSFNHRDFGRAPASFGVLPLLPRDAFRRLQT